MLTSSVLNSVTFKDISGVYPNKWSRLHADRNQGGLTVMPYCQLFNKDDVVLLQFESDSDTVPELKIFIPHLNDTVNGTLVSSYNGDITRRFYNFQITLDAQYYNKKIYFTVSQDTITLTSEPIFCEDLTEGINRGIIKRVKYTNLDRNNSDLSSYWVDWSAIDYMFFYIEAIDADPNDIEEVEILDGAQSKEIISATNYSGINLQCAPMPDYMAIKLKACTSLDYFEVNDIQYIKDGDVSVGRSGNSTLQEVSVNLTEKNTIGLNVDDRGIEFIDQETIPMPTETKRNNNVTAAGWQVENPSGYMLHSVFVKHTGGSAGNATIKLGITVAGDELIDEVQGNIPLADYSVNWRSYSQHFLKNPDAASTLYFSVSGAGAILDIIVNFDTVTED